MKNSIESEIKKKTMEREGYKGGKLGLESREKIIKELDFYCFLKIINK